MQIFGNMNDIADEDFLDLTWNKHLTQNEAYTESIEVLVQPVQGYDPRFIWSITQTKAGANVDKN